MRGQFNGKVSAHLRREPSYSDPVARRPRANAHRRVVYTLASRQYRHHLQHFNLTRMEGELMFALDDQLFPKVCSDQEFNGNTYTHKSIYVRT